MSFKDAFNKAKGKGKSPLPIDAVNGDGKDLANEKSFTAKKPAKKGGFAEAAKNAKKKKCKK